MACHSSLRLFSASVDVAKVALLTFPPTTQRSWYGRAFRLTFETFHSRTSREYPGRADP